MSAFSSKMTWKLSTFNPGIGYVSHIMHGTQPIYRATAGFIVYSSCQVPLQDPTEDYKQQAAGKSHEMEASTG
jgi:hypothetical protein